MKKEKIIPIAVHPITEWYNNACKSEIQRYLDKHFNLSIAIDADESYGRMTSLYVNAKRVIRSQEDKSSVCSIINPCQLNEFENSTNLEIILMGGEINVKRLEITTTPGCHYIAYEDLIKWFKNQQITKHLIVHIPFNAIFDSMGRPINEFEDTEGIIKKYSKNANDYRQGWGGIKLFFQV